MKFESFKHTGSHRDGRIQLKKEAIHPPRIGKMSIVLSDSDPGGIYLMPNAKCSHMEAFYVKSWVKG